MTVSNLSVRPRNGHTLQVISARRVSDPGPGKQDIRSLDDQGALLDRWLDEHASQPRNVTALAGSGSGEYLERAEYLRLIELVESDQFDLVITEDLGRIIRRIHAHLFCELCVDHGVRLIAINDHVDTAEPGWQDRSIFSAWHHERSNRDTSERIKRTHRNRFLHGGTASLPIFGYRKKPGAKSDDDWEKLPEAEQIYREWFDRLDHDALYAEVGDWLNEAGVPTGPHSRTNKKWDGRMVARVTHNWLLKGVRFRNKRKTRRISTGKYKSEKADPRELLTRHVPHLAFFEEAYYDRVVAKADARNAKYRRSKGGAADPCANRPKKRVRYPGQSLCCGVCGRPFVFGAHGQTDHLMCSGAREYLCWNAISLNGPLTAQAVAASVLAEIETLRDFDAAFVDMVNEEAQKLDVQREHRLYELQTLIEKRQSQIQNLVDYISGGCKSPNVAENLGKLEAELPQLQAQRAEIEGTASQVIIMPSAAEIKQLVRQSVRDLALESYEFTKLMRRLVRDFFVFPYRSCDGKDFVLRGTARLQLANLLPDQRLRDTLRGPLERVLNLDLFVAPQRIRLREQVMALRREMTEREAAERLGITKTAAQYAAGLDRLMGRLGLADPYVRMTKPPTDYPKMRRHLHPRFRFDPLPGFGTE
jgi:site-specific DNA recombinase